MKKIIWGILLSILITQPVFAAYNLGPNSGFDFIQTAQGTGLPILLNASNAAHTGGTAATAWPQIQFDMSAEITRATGAVTHDYAFLINSPRLGFVAASTVTLADGFMFNSCPQEGTNGTITHSSCIAIAQSVNNAVSAHGMMFTVPGIENAEGNVTERSGIYFNDTQPVLLGNQTANLTDLYGINLNGTSATSSVLTRTVTGNVAMLRIGSTFTAGANVVFNNTALSLFVDSGLSRFDDQIMFGAGTAITAANYSVGRDADGTNQLHFNSPDASTMEWSINDVAEMVLSATTLAMQTNTITGIGSAITGTASTAMTISVPNTANGAGVNLTVQAASAGGAGDNAGGDIILQPGLDTGNGSPGSVDFYTVAGALALSWSDYAVNDSLFGADAGDVTYFGIFAGPPTLDFGILRTASSANYLRVAGAAAASEPVLSAQGSDADINITLTPKGTGVVDASASSIRVKRSIANITVPPTDAELDSAFGDPTVVGAGFIGVVDDNDAGTDVYWVYTTGTAGEWFYIAGTKAL